MEYQEIKISPKCQHLMAYRSQHNRLSRSGIRQIGICQAQENYFVSRKCPSFYMLICTLSGAGKIHLSSDTSIQLEAYSLMLVPISQRNTLELADEHWHFAWLMLDAVAPWLDLQTIETPLLLEPQTCHLIKHCAEGLVLASDDSTQAVQTIADAQLGLLQQTLTALTPAEGNYTQSQHSPSHRRLQHGFDQIGQRLHKQWTVAQMSEMMFISEPHLHRLCNQLLGISPKKKLMQLRMEKAKRLLLDTDFSIGQIAELVGYPDSGNFATRYKKYWGMPPSVIRRVN